jgi:hypothetical protein
MLVGASLFSFLVATVAAALPTETSTKKGGQNARATLNAKLSDRDQVLAAKRVTPAEHNRRHAMRLAKF